jgi:hypothetical protein
VSTADPGPGGAWGATPGGGAGHRRGRPATGGEIGRAEEDHTRMMRLIASARDFASNWNTPRTADVIVFDPAF